KTEARLVESRICSVRADLANNNTSNAANAWNALSEQLDARPDAAAATTDTAALVDETWQAGTAALPELRTQIIDTSLNVASGALDRGKCEAARTEQTFLIGFAPDAKKQLAELNARVERECTTAPAVVVENESSAMPPVGAIVLMSVGAAVL